MFRRSVHLAAVLVWLIVVGSTSAQTRTEAAKPATLWPELLQLDAAKAYQAMRKLAAAPDETLSYLREVAPPARRTATDQQIADLIRQLDSARFGERDKARQELEKLDWQAAPALRKAAAKTGALELKRRLEQLLGRLEGPLTGVNLRWHRAVEVVEWIGAMEAKTLLERWSRGAAASRLTEEASKALKRWGGRDRLNVNVPKQRPVADPQGDPLPAGVILRLGSTRWRLGRGSIGYERGGILYTADSKKLIIAGDGSIGILDASSGNVLTRRAVQGSIGGMRLSPDGRRLLISNVIYGRNVRSHVLHVWDAADLKDIATWIAEGNIEGFADNGRAVLLATDKGIRRLDPATGQEVAFMPFAKDAEGTLRAFNGKTAVVVSRRARLSAFELSAPEKVRHLDMPDREPRSVALSGDGKYLAIGGDHDYGVLIYDLVRGEPIRYIASKASRRDFVIGLAFAPDSKSLAFCSGYEKPVLVLWDLETRRPRWKVAASAGQLVFSPDGKFIAGNAASRTRVWDAATGMELSEIGDIPAGDLRELTFTPDGRYLFDMNSDAARIWEFPSGELFRTFSLPNPATPGLSPARRLTTAVMAPDGRRVATATFSGKVHIWDVATGKETMALPGPAPYMSGMAFSVDGRRLVTWGTDIALRIWNLENGRLLAEHRPRPEGFPDIDLEDTRERRRRDLAGKDVTPFSSALIADGSRLVWHFNKLRMYDTQSGKEVAAFEEKSSFHYHGVKASSDLEWLLIGGWGANQPSVVYNLRHGKQFGRVDAAASGNTGNVAMTRDGRCFALSTHQPAGAIHVYETLTLQRRLTIPLEYSTARILAFSPEGRFLAAALSDGVVLVWDLLALEG